MSVNHDFNSNKLLYT